MALIGPEGGPTPVHARDVAVRGRRSSAPAVDDPLQRSNLSRAQFLMWLGQEIDPEVPLYNMIQTFRIEGPVDPAAFDQAWQMLVRRSDALRTTVARRDGAPWRTVHDEMAVPVEVVNLRETANPDGACRAWIEDRKVRPLRLRERLWDTALLLLDDEVAVWYLCQHHLITDGQSFAVTYRYVSECYALALAGRLGEARPLPAYEDFLAHEVRSRSSPALSKASDYWRAKLAEPKSPTPFYGRAVSGRTARTDRLVLDIGHERSERFRQIARRPEFQSLSEGLSLHTIWATLLFTVLHRITGQSALRVGTPFLARPTAVFRETVGLFIEIGSLDVEVGREDTFPTLARRVQRELMQGVLHALPGVSSAELNRSYDVLVNYVTSRFDSFAGHPVTTDWVHTGYGDRDHALRLQIADFDASGAFRLYFDVNADVFGEAERAWLLDQFQVVLDRFIEDPTRGLGAFDLLSPDQRRHQVEEFNATDTDYPRGATVVDLFEEQARATPDAIAVQFGERTLSYAELDAEANRVAHLLQRHGVGTETTVAICARRSTHAITAVLGVLKAGGAYVPIDPSYPTQRRRFMIDDAQPKVVLTAGVDLGGEGLTSPVIDLTTTALDDCPAETPPSRRRPEGLAYVIYTSGSTGRPKGTLLTHRGLVNYLWWARQQYQQGEALDFPLYSSLSFDLTITSLFVPLISGGRVVVYEGSSHGEGLEILDVFADDQVDIVKLTPAHLSLLREQGFECRRIRRLIVGGENFRTELARDVSESFRHEVAIFNEYGPTETVVGCMVHRYDPATDTGPSVPIGRPAANARIHVLDPHDQPVPPGVVGEMVVSGDGVALGYRNQPELTAERFGDDPTRPGARWYRTGDLARWGADGRLEFLGRDDHQVKIRGARIELGEIETALLAHPAIESAVVDVVTLGGAASGRVSHCVKCGLPSNYPGAEFDDSGECADCRAYARYREQVARYFRTPGELQQVLDEVKRRAAGPRHDCLVLVSGGKDSTYMLYQLVREYGLRPLVFTLDNGYISDAALDNVRSACADLGVELHAAKTPHMNAIFADSLQRHSNVCNGCFKTVYTLSMGLARERGIDTIVTGLSRGQLFETRLADTFAAREFDPGRIDRWVMEARQAYHQIDDAVYQLLDTDLFRNEASFQDIRFVDFYRFVDVDLDEVYRYLSAETSWRRPTDTGRSTNCLINEVGIYVHKKARGFHNYALPYSWDVRLGHKRREAAIQELDDDVDIDRVRRILGELAYEEPLEDAASDKRLAAYYVGKGELGSSEVRAHLAACLPAYMVPTYLIPLRELPLTVNGKVDRAALPDPRRVRTDLATTFTAPSTETERRLAAIWGSVFRRPEVGVHDNFFDLGGDSIMSIQIVAEARRQGMLLSARDIFTHQTIAGLARLVDAATAVDGARTGEAVAPRLRIELGDEVRERVAALLAEAGGWDGVEDVYPLTPTQLGMLYHSLRSADPQTYFGQGTCALSGPVETEKLKEAWKTVCQRHPATRVRFVWSGLDTPVQVVQRETSFPWEEHDWRGRSVEDARRGLDDLRRRQREAGFDLNGGALMSFALVRTDEATHFVWNSHHALLDGWAAHLLFDQVLDEYEALVSGRARAPREVRPFRDHVWWLADRNGAAAQRWWKEYLSGVEGATPLPLPAPPRSDERGHGSLWRKLDAVLSTRVQEFAREQRLTLSTLANGAWGLLLSHYGGTDDVVFGATVSGRDEGVSGIESMVGMLIATLPVRLRLDPGRPIGEWLHATQVDGLESRRQGHLGLADIQRLTEVPTTQALFDTIVVIENYPTAQSRHASSLRPAALEIGAPSNFALALLVHPGDQLALEAVYDRTRLSSDTVTRLLGHLEQTLTSMVESADRRLGDVLVVTEAERSVLRTWGSGARCPGPDRLVHEIIAEQAGSNPDRLAVAGAGEGLTYEALERRSNQLAHGLRDIGIEPGDCVGLVAGGSAVLVAGVLAILKASATYVPIDRELPPERLAHIMGETGMRVLLVDGDFAAPDGSAAAVVDLSTFPFDAHPSDPPTGGPSADDVAYVIYTSGSTGTPKGVMVTHRNIAHSTAVRFAFYGERVESFLLLSSLAFDSSMVGLFWTLASGGTLVVPPGERRHDVLYLGAEIERHGITHLLALPSLYGLLLDETTPGQLRSLRTVIVAGEACPVALVASHQSRCPGAALYNEYGPTEGTVWCHAFRVPDGFDGSSVPIGVPIPNSWCHVLDRFGHPTAIGVPGELVIGGPGIAVGYLRRPDLTELAFETLPPSLGVDPDERHYRTGDLVRWRTDGNLEFLGRADRQVKLRGYRIELDEIERVLLDSPGVRGAAAFVADVGHSDPNRRRLVACYCADEGLDMSAWRASVAARLPRFMLPSEFVRLAEMPMTATGKVDRQALPALVAEATAVHGASREPADGLERMMRDAWARVLGRSDVGMDQDFFELGGNSLDAMRLFAHIERVTGRSMLLSTLFEAPTAAGLAELLRRPPRAPAISSLVPIKPTGHKRPFYYVGPYEISVIELGRIAKYFDSDRPFFGLQPSGLQEGEEIHETVEKMAAHYVAAIKTHQPSGPYLIGGHCDGSWVAHEMAIQLRDRGEVVAYLALTDVSPPAGELPSKGWLANVVDRIAYYRRDGRLGYAVAHQLRVRLENELLFRFGPVASRRVRAVRKAHGRAFGRHKLEYDHRTPVHLVRSTELAGIMDQISWYDGLRAGDNRVVVTDIRSTHARLLMEPETKELAEALSRGLDAADPGI